MMLMIPETSIALELALSTSRQVLGNFRSRMAANTLEALVCGQDWFHSDEGDDYIELVE
jgi:hypothetical protein